MATILRSRTALSGLYNHLSCAARGWGWQFCCLADAAHPKASSSHVDGEGGPSEVVGSADGEETALVKHIKTRILVKESMDTSLWLSNSNRNWISKCLAVWAIANQGSHDECLDV